MSSEQIKIKDSKSQNALRELIKFGGKISIQSPHDTRRRICAIHEGDCSKCILNHLAKYAHNFSLTHHPLCDKVDYSENVKPNKQRGISTKLQQAISQFLFPKKHRQYLSVQTALLKGFYFDGYTVSIKNNRVSSIKEAFEVDIEHLISTIEIVGGILKEDHSDTTKVDIEFERYNWLHDICERLVVFTEKYKYLLQHLNRRHLFATYKLDNDALRHIKKLGSLLTRVNNMLNNNVGVEYRSELFLMAKVVIDPSPYIKIIDDIYNTLQNLKNDLKARD